MVKTILIPIDFRVASLKTLKFALDSYEKGEESIQVILLHSEYLNDSITDLLFYSPYKLVESKMTASFQEALEVLKNRFEARLAKVDIEVFHGYTLKSFVTFLATHQVDTIYIPKTYRLKTRKSVFDPIPLIQKSNVKVIEIEWDTVNDDQTEEEQLITLFN